MFTNLSTEIYVYGQVLESVTASFSYEGNARPRSEVRSSPGKQQPFTGSDFGDTPARELALFGKKWLQRTAEYT